MTNEELTALVREISTKWFSKPFLHTAYFNTRLRTTGGRYMLGTHAIEINPKSYETYGYSELEGIIKHELCHYHLHLEGKGYKHRDQDFRKLLLETKSPRFCLLPEEVVQRKSRKTYTYVCLSCRTPYKRKIRMNVEKYRCGRCAGKLTSAE